MAALKYDIFCKVIDNFGDVGVSWRLARQLSSELGHDVRLFVDDLRALSALWPSVSAQLLSQRVETVEVVRWGADLPFLEPADVVVEAFGAAVDAPYLRAMVERQPLPVWILLEYLSAESWVEGCHGLPSPHPHLPLLKHFFFPGFTAATGGVLVERDLPGRRDAFQRDPRARMKFFAGLGVDPSVNALWVSLFAYENAALPEIVDAWSAGKDSIVCIVPAGKALSQLESILSKPLRVGSTVLRGRLRIAPIPFLDVTAYDRLLWACGVNFVRGEDSFVRAQLAARPLIWQAYPQQEDAHSPKVQAFLDRYTQGNSSTAQAAHRALIEAWNAESPDVARCWDAFLACRAETAAHASAWAVKLVNGPKLAQGLAAFCAARLK